jgi:dihydroorotase-like cyclic amidohydrolase
MRYTICSTGCLAVTENSRKRALKAGYAAARAAFSGGVTTVYVEPGDDDDTDIATQIARWHRHPGRARPMRIEAF